MIARPILRSACSTLALSFISGPILRSLTLADRGTAGPDLVGVLLAAQRLGSSALGRARLLASHLLRPLSATDAVVGIASAADAVDAHGNQTPRQERGQSRWDTRLVSTNRGCRQHDSSRPETAVQDPTQLSTIRNFTVRPVRVLRIRASSRRSAVRPVIPVHPRVVCAPQFPQSTLFHGNRLRRVQPNGTP